MPKHLVYTLALASCALVCSRPDAAAAQQHRGAPRPVKIALILADLTEVDGAAQSFDADVYLRASWRDPSLVDPAANDLRTVPLGEVWHPTLLMHNLRQAERHLPEEVMVQRNGDVTYLQRYVGTFSDPMDLQQYPKDSQEFSIRVIAANRSGAYVTLEPDPSLGVLRSADFSVADWDVGEATLFADPLVLAESLPSISGVTLQVPATRRLTYFVIQVLIPLFAIVFMAYAVFWIPPTVVPPRIGVAVTTMLTLIAYRFMLANHVPRIAYLTRLDWFMLGATVLVLLVLFAMAGTAYLVGRDREETATKVDRIARVLYPLALTAFGLIVWLT